MLDFTHHPQDKGILLLGSVEDLPAMGNDFYKGASIKEALPEDVAEFLLDASDDQIDKIVNKAINIDAAGEPIWSDVKKSDVPECFIGFADRACAAFNQISDRPAILTLSRDKGTLASIFPRFHFDTRDVHDHATMRAVMSVSDDGLDHETEWVATDGMHGSDLQKLLVGSKNKLISDLDPDLAKHILVAKQRELFAFRGLSKDRSNALTDGCAHRAPPFKNTYPQRGFRRMSVVLDEVIDWGNDFNY